MSSFSALNGAYTSLNAQRIALEAVGQNISNVNTPGYTRQRVNLEAITGGTQPTMTGTARGLGVRVTSVERLGDLFAETKLRTQTSSASRLGAVAAGWRLVETSVKEPSEKGLAAGLDTFFTSWQDVANRPDDTAAKAVLLGNANSLVAAVADSYRAAESQWVATRDQASAIADDVNTTAVAVADLNARIRDAQVSGVPANELIDQRGVLLTDLASLVGGEVRARADGTIDVMVGGNALVRGDQTYAVAVHGTSALEGLAGASSMPDDGWGAHAGPPRLVWAASGDTAGATGGRLSGLVDTLATDGPFAGMAASYDALVTTIAAEVNALHSSLPGHDGVTRDFFSFAPGLNPALGLRVAVTDIAHLTTGVPGEVEGSIATAISKLSGARDLWGGAVVDLGVSTRAAVRRAEAAEHTRGIAEGQLLSHTAVDLDEESVNLVMYQRAYEAAARVLTTVDEMLDTLINRTGVVGR
ncbi:flagellar hook-associated protein FlgK [Georgenia wutianyii]|uniref:Flagellar hook-associated protein 1 n=1 Tax=Georgenia wutianyii TaxID=2585135 RepID=A0ABX5VMV0_9MICO|nr:flagellar hook-associated protein FlgK [Georgenia wutianyii]QDB78155.1 flagellar hook-associated protein FlgK [Georgenia wutianyii]